MAKVKRSDMMRKEIAEKQNPPAPEPNETTEEEPVTTQEPETTEEPETAQEPETTEEPVTTQEAPEAAEGEPGTAEEDVVAPPDPRDVTIRHLQVGLTLVSLVAVILIVAVILLMSRGTASEPAPTSSPSVPAASAPYYSLNYVSVNPNVKQGAIIVEIHDDYQCPWCERAEEIYGDALQALSQSGDIDLRIHIRTLVGDQIIHNDSSERAGIAALCANTVGHFWDYHSTVFANQPAEGVGYTDDQLRTVFAAQAGITDQDLTDFQTCYDTKATSNLLTAMEQEGTAAGINGTPTFFVNGQKASFDLQAGASTIQQAGAADLLAGLESFG